MKRTMWLLVCAVPTALLFILFTAVPRSAARAAEDPERPFGPLRPLSAESPQQRSYFGRTVSVSGDTIMVGAEEAQVGQNEEQGTVTVFQRSGPGLWQRTQTLVAPDGRADDHFGARVIVRGNTAVISAIFSPGGSWPKGAVYVFQREGGLWRWQQRLADPPPDPLRSRFFGYGLAFDGRTILVGAPSYDYNTPGVVYDFRQEGGVWVRKQEIAGAASHDFGSTVAVEGDTVVIGAPYDQKAWEGGTSIYFYQRSGGVWSGGTALKGSLAYPNDAFGSDLALSGGLALVGAPGGDHCDSANPCLVYLFGRSGGVWRELDHIANSDDGAFGGDVALEGETAVIGAHREVGGGAAYVYAVENGALRQTQRLNPLAPGGRFGSDVAVDGDIAVVGAPYADAAAVPGAGLAFATERPARIWPFRVLLPGLLAP